MRNDQEMAVDGGWCSRAGQAAETVGLGPSGPKLIGIWK